jgi:ABC-type phosphate/phosphonate transport system ATPase subunit
VVIGTHFVNSLTTCTEFYPQPTSGLDSRSALLVVKTLRKIADGKRTICATIHQPSSAVFSMFVSLDAVFENIIIKLVRYSLQRFYHIG